MTGPSESDRSQTRLVAGGTATQAGILFQNRVAAWIAVRILAEQDTSSLWDLSETTTLERLYCETSEPVDDLLVNTTANGFIFIQVKHRVTLTAHPRSALASCLDQFVRQFLISLNRGKGTTSIKQPLSPDKDRFVLIMGPDSSLALQRALPNLLRKLRSPFSLQVDIVDNSNKEEKKVWKVLESCVRRSWETWEHAIPSQEDIRQVLSFVHAETLHVDAGDSAEREALDSLRQVILHRPAQAQSAWMMLIQVCGEFSMRRGSLDRAYLQKTLLNAHFLLQAQRSYQEDIEHLRAHSRMMVSVLEQEVKRSSLVEIQRRSTAVLHSEAEEASFLVVGVPGSGKSSALLSLVLKLLNEGRDVVFLAVDRLDAESLGTLRINLNLSHEVLDILEHWPGLNPAFLVLDALDAGKSDRTAQTLRDLMGLTIRMNSRWRVIASIRKFDLRYDLDIQNLFAGSPLSSEFQDAEFSRLRHIEIPALSDSELDQVTRKDPALASVLTLPNQTLRELLRIPFNLRIMHELLKEGVPLRHLTPIRTHLELLHRYWTYRVIGKDRQRGYREQVLQSVAEGMVKTRTLRMEKRELGELLSSSPAIDDLLKLHVLIEWQDQSYEIIDDSVLAFSHHILFDYAVARLILRGKPTHVAHLLENDPDLVLALRPSLTYYFQQLWMRDKEKKFFWEATLYIIGQKHIPAIGKLIGPIIAAESATHLADLELLLSALENKNQTVRATAETALEHLIGALAAGRPHLSIVGKEAGPWDALLERISQSEQRIIVYRTRTLLTLLDEQPDELTANQRSSIGRAARRLLEIAWKIQPHDPWLINHAIQGVCRTFESDKDASEILLRRCLDLAHVAKYGYIELPWLTREGKHLLAFAPQFVEDLYKRVFSYEETREDRTNMDNSRILALASTPRQEYQMARYILVELYPAFLRQAPVHALRVLIQMVDGHLSSHSGRAQADRFTFEETEAQIIADLSVVWDAGDTFRQDDLLKMLDAFDTFLVELASNNERRDEQQRVLDLLATQNRYAVLWRHLLLCGSRAPLTLGAKIRSLAWALPILIGIDTTTAAGNFLAATFHEFSPSEREKVERAICSIPTTVDDETRESAEGMRDRLIGCLVRDAITTEEVKLLIQRIEEEGGPPLNVPLIEPFVSRFVRREEPEDESQRMRRPLRAFASTHMQVLPTTQEVEDVFPFLFALYAWLNADKRSDDSWLDNTSAWGDLSEVCERITGWEGFSCDGDIGSFVQSILFQVASHPEPALNEDIDRQFDSSPAWGKPVPRIDAAAGLTRLARHKNCATSELLAVIEKLSLDTVPAVRFQVVREVLSLSQTAPDLMWIMIEHWVRDETNNGVLQGLFIGKALLQLAWQDADRIASLTKELFDRIKEGNGSEAIREGCISVFAFLYLRQNEPLSREIITAIIQKPAHFFNENRYLLANLKGVIDLGTASEILSPFQEAIRQRAWDIIQRLLEVLGKILLAPQREQDGLPNDTPLHLQNALRLADIISLDLCAASGAISNGPGRSLEERKRFLLLLGWLLDTLTEFGHPGLAHHLIKTLEVLIPADPAAVFIRIGHVVQVSLAGGYQYESLAAEMIVRIVERYLAEFRGVLREHEECRKTLIELLDSFVVVGWPDARKLTYRLEEIFR